MFLGIILEWGKKGGGEIGGPGKRGSSGNSRGKPCFPKKQKPPFGAQGGLRLFYPPKNFWKGFLLFPRAQFFFWEGYYGKKIILTPIKKKKKILKKFI